MNDDINDKRLAAIAELAAALDEFEHGDGLQRLTDGHGLQSRVFASNGKSHRSRSISGFHTNAY